MHEEIIGDTFHFWTVQGRSDKTYTDGTRLFKCICKCGKIGYVTGFGLKHGKSKSCGCSRKLGMNGKTKLERIHGKMKFKDLWYNHPANDDDTNPCFSTESNFSNQCAIRMGVALQRSGFSVENYRGATCKTDYNFKPECDDFHPIRVNDLLMFLGAKMGKPISVKNAVYEDFHDRKGIIVFLDFWGKNMQGDHIDLWDGQSMTYGSRDYFERAREILFWDVD